MTLSNASHELFMAFAKDAPNWSGMPPTTGNVGMSKEQRGNLTQLKKAGLLTTEYIDGDSWVIFTSAGRAYAKANGVEIE